MTAIDELEFLQRVSAAGHRLSVYGRWRVFVCAFRVAFWTSFLGVSQ